MARRAGLKSRGKQARYMEQMYTAIYFGVLGPAGMYVMSRTPVWYFNTRGFYEGFPHKTLEGVFKFYYLFQAAYWAQQAIVLLLGMEKPRKDFKELVGHHIVSLTLIALSYRFHFTYIGLAVYITHDISDFFLAVSLCLTSPSFSQANPLFPDLQNPQLPRPPPHRPLLLHLHGRLDLPAPLPQPAHPLLPLHRVQDGRPLRDQLGDGPVQVPAVLLDHPHPAQLAAVAQPVLALLHPAHRLPLCAARRGDGRPERGRGVRGRGFGGCGEQGGEEGQVRVLGRGLVWLVYFPYCFLCHTHNLKDFVYITALHRRDGGTGAGRALAFFFFVFVTRQGKLHSLLLVGDRGDSRKVLCWDGIYMAGIQDYYLIPKQV